MPKSKRFLSILAVEGIALMIVIGLAGTVSAFSTVPKSVSIGVTEGWYSPSHSEQIHVMSKQLDNALWDDGLSGTWFWNRYFVLQGGLFDRQYSGSSKYLYVTFYGQGSPTGTWPKNTIDLVIDGKAFKIYLPPIVIYKNYDWQLYSFYIAEDGSSFYARDDHAPSGGLHFDDATAGSIDLSPSQAMVSEHLARAAPISATVDIKPDTLDKASQGGTVTAYIYIKIPGYDVNNIDVSTVELSTNNGIVSAMLFPTEVGDYDSDGIPDLMLKFDRPEVIGIVDVGDVVVTISGKIYGEDFEGSDVIRVIDNHA